MVYNKTAIYKWRGLHPEEYKEIYKKSLLKSTRKNPEKTREYDRLRKTPFATEWRILRQIALF